MLAVVALAATGCTVTVPGSGVATTVSQITAVDYQALAEADLVVVGTWTDGLVLFGTILGARVRMGPRRVQQAQMPRGSPTVSIG